MFGQTKPLFGAAAAPTFGFGSSPFGSATASTAQPSLGIFGQPAASAPQQNMFPGSAFGAAVAVSKGSVIPFNPPVSTDSVQRNGQKIQVNSKHMCITAMKEYQDRSLEELRLEDYMLNKKSGSAGSSNIFGVASKPLSFNTTTTAGPLFGASASSNQSKPLFGGTTSLFGAAQPATAFGQPTQNSLFGNKPMFGASNASTNVFGTASSSAPQNQLNLGFGQVSQPQGTIFGNKPAFGATTTSASYGIFGAQNSQPTATGFGFAKPQATGLFGTAPTTSGLFGGTQAAATSVPFGAATTQSTGIFGGIRPTGATPLFGGNTASNVSSGFGFGAGFGAKPSTSSSGLFSNAFNSSALATKPTGFGFATSQANTGFGLALTSSAVQPNLGSGLFAAKKPLFSAATTANTGFGFNTGTQSTGIFGGGFSGISQAIQPTNSLFGNAAGGTSLFGAQPGVGTGLSMTGFRQPAPTFGFSATGQTGQSLFGATVPAVGNPGGFLGGQFGTTTGAFGQTGLNATPSLGVSLGGVGLGSNAAALGPLVEQVTQNARAQQHVLDLVRNMPYGQSALFRHLNAESSTPNAQILPPSTSTPSNTAAITQGGSKTTGGSILSGQAVASTLAERHKAAGLVIGSPMRLPRSCTRRPLQQLPLSRHQLFAGFHEDDALVSAQSPGLNDSTKMASSPAVNDRFFVRRDAWKRLQIPESIRNSTIERSATALSEMTNQCENQQISKNPSDYSGPASNVSEVRKVSVNGDGGNENTSNVGGKTTPRVQFLDSTSVTPLQNRHNDQLKPVEESKKCKSPSLQESDFSSPKPSLALLGSNKQLPSLTSSNPEDLDTTWSLPPDATLGETVLIDSDTETGRESSTHPAGIQLNKPRYYIFPTLEELAELVDEDGRCVVQDLIIGRQSYGYILFPGLSDITGINFDDVVHIRRREVVVYPDDALKPPVGYGLNRRAEVTLDGIWPTDKSNREFIQSPERLAAIRFEERLEKATQKMDATFIEYRPDTGSWVFEVKHFSKYRLEDSDDEGDVGMPIIPGPGDPPAVTVTMVSENSKFSNMKRQPNVMPLTDIYGEKEVLNQFVKEKAQSELDELDEDRDMDETSIWTARVPSTFRNVRDSLFLGCELDNLNEDLEEIDDTGEYGVTAASGRRMLQRRLRDLKDKGAQNTVASACTASFKDNDDSFFDLVVVKQSPETCTREIHVDGTPFCVDVHIPVVKPEPVHGIHNPMLYVPRPFSVDLLGSHKHLSYSNSVPFEKIAALLGEDPISSRRSFSRFFLDAGLSIAAAGVPISWSFSRESGQPQCQVIVSSRPIDDAFEDLDEHAIDAPIVCVNRLTPPFIDLEEEILLNASMQTSSQPSLSECTGGVDWEMGACADFCPPAFLPNPGLEVLNSYHVCLETTRSSSSIRSSQLTAFQRVVYLCQALWGHHGIVTDTVHDQNSINMTFNAPTGRRFSDNTFACDQDDGEDGSGGIAYGNRFTAFCLNRLARKQAVSEWIRSQLRPWLLARLLELGLSKVMEIPSVSATGDKECMKALWSLHLPIETVFTAIFACLCCGESGLACRLAIASQLPGLASLLSQTSPGDPIYRQGIQKQLQVWHELKVDVRIPHTLLRIYALLAGEIYIMNPQTGIKMNVLENTSYLQALGIHLWYLTDYTSDLPHVLKLFSRNWHDFSASVAAPVPPSPEELGNTSTKLRSPRIVTPDGLHEPESLKSREWPRDVAYHLLQLKCRRCHSLERTLDPRCLWRRPDSANNPQCGVYGANRDGLTDWAASWHLWRILESLGHRHLTAAARSRLHAEYSAQLEATGYWEWAVFVLLHEVDPVVRAASVKRLLARHVTLHQPTLPTSEENHIRLDNECVFSQSEIFVTDRLNVPKRWLHEAKACLARSRLIATNFSARGRRHLFAHLEATHWLAAGHLDAAHAVCTYQILPDMILHSELGATAGSAVATVGGAFNLHRKSNYVRLAGRLLSLLEPFAQIPPENRPSTYDAGAGIYYTYGRLLHLTNQLSVVAESQAPASPSCTPTYTAPDPSQSLLAETLEQLQETGEHLCTLIQGMPVRTVRERVVRSELALAAASLVSAFVHSRLPRPDIGYETSGKMDKDEEQAADDMLESLRRYAQLITQLGLPGESRLHELESLSTVGITHNLV